MEIAIIVLGIVVVLLAYVCFKLNKKVAYLEDEVTNMRYIRVKQNIDGSYTLTSQDGKPMFEL